MAPKNILPREKIADFIDNLYDGDLHAKRVLSLANATLGVLVSASLAVHAIGQGLARALGKLSKHGVKQVDRLLSNQGIDVWEFFGYWVPYLVGRIGETTHRSALLAEYRHGRDQVRCRSGCRHFAVIEVQFGTRKGGSTARRIARRMRRGLGRRGATCLYPLRTSGRSQDTVSDGEAGSSAPGALIRAACRDAVRLRRCSCRRDLEPRSLRVRVSRRA